MNSQIAPARLFAATKTSTDGSSGPLEPAQPLCLP